MMKFVTENKLLVFSFSLLAISVLLHLMSYQYPFVYEDEALYLFFGKRDTVAPDAGIVWKVLVSIGMFIFYGSEFKLIPLLFGLSGAFCFYLIIKRGLNLKTTSSLLLTVLYISSPIFYSQAHRIRPEIVHVFFALCATSLYILTINNPKINDLTSILKDKYFIIGTFCLLMVPHSHVMGVLHLPAIGLLLAYLFYSKTGSIKDSYVGLSIIAVLFFATLFILLPGLLKNKLHHFDSFQTNTFTETLQKAWSMFTVAFRVWYGDLHNQEHIIWPKLFASGKHLRLEGLILYFLALLSCIFVVIRAFLSKANSKQTLISCVAGINCICYLVAIVIFRRLNNSYNIILLPWMLISIASAFSQLDWKENIEPKINKYWAKVVICALLFSFVISIVHNINFVFPLRKTNFNQLLTNLETELDRCECKNVSTASTPYFIFLQEDNPLPILPFGDIIAQNSIKTNPEGFRGAHLDTLNKEDSCVIVIARNYYSYDWWGQYADSMGKLREILSKDFDELAEISMPFYKNDPFYPRMKKNADFEYPMGADTIYIGGKETIWIYKKKAPDQTM